MVIYILFLELKIAITASSFFSSLNGKGINNFYSLRNTTFRSRLNKFGRGAIRLYSTQVKTTNITPLDPWFVTGFCDGESNFHVSITSRSDNPLK